MRSPAAVILASLFLTFSISGKADLLLNPNGIANALAARPGADADMAKPAGPYRAGATTVLMPRYSRYVPDFADLAATIRDGKKLAISPEVDLLVQETLMRACDAKP